MKAVKSHHNQASSIKNDLSNKFSKQHSIDSKKAN
jgi:hypothetical protein